MRKALALVTVVLTLVPLLGSPTASAAPVRRIYEGTTSAGGDIAFVTLVRDGRIRLVEVQLEAEVSCPDGSTTDFDGGFGFGGGPRIVGGAFDLDVRFIDQAIVASGTLGTKQGTGTIRQVNAALDAEEEPQTCSTGDLTWTVHRVDRRTPTPAGATIRRIHANGMTRTTVTGGAASSAAAVDPGAIRQYDGRMAPEGRLTVVTGRGATGLELVELGVEWGMTCDDGTDFGLGFFISFGEGQTLDPGRLDYDEHDFIALHVHGRLGPHAGDGTASMIMPILDENLEAEGCRTGERTWRAWRTDAGAIRV